jgi:hypothetical protein
LTLQNYQHRFPLPALVINRILQLDAATMPGNGMVLLELGDHGRMEMASGHPTYLQNTIHMAGDKEKKLFNQSTG